MVEEHDFLVYHLGSGPKFVKHAFERSCALAYPPDEEARAQERSKACLTNFGPDPRW